MQITPEVDADHWFRTRNLTIAILVLWTLFGLGVHLFSAWLNTMTFLGFPLGYYMAAQGSLIVLVLLVFVHAWQQDEIDDDHGQDDG